MEILKEETLKNRSTNKGVLRKKDANKKIVTSKKENNSYFYSNVIYSLVQDYVKSKNYKIDDLIKVLNISAYTLPTSYSLPIDSKNFVSNFTFPHSKDKEKLIFPSNYQKNSTFIRWNFFFSERNDRVFAHKSGA